MLNGTARPRRWWWSAARSAGCSTPSPCGRLGCEVDVFEKSSGLMKDRGAGIVFQQEVADFLTRTKSPRWSPSSSLSAPAATLIADGSVLQEGPMPQAMTSWDMLYRKLRAAFGTTTTMPASGWLASRRPTTK